MNQESDENAINTIAVPAEPAHALVIDALPQVRVGAQPHPMANALSGLKPDEYPTLATLGEVDLNQRLGGLLLDDLFGLPAFALYFVPGMRLIGSVLSTIYWLSRDAFLDGQSFGKRIVKERVITLDGSRFTWKHSALRNISTVPGAIAGILASMWPSPTMTMVSGAVGMVVGIAEIVCVVSTKRRIGDYLAKTKVVYADR